MKLSDKVRNISGVVTVEIEGFFTERFINLCKINNVKIWDIRNVVSGVVRFKIHYTEFRKLKPITKKTKCRLKIKDKQGIYFKFFRYRRRKVLFASLILLFMLFILSTCFIWNVGISGNKNVANAVIEEKLKDAGIYIGRFKIGMDKNDVLRELRATIPDIAWVGLEIKGTHAQVKVVEKVYLEDKDIQDTRLGDIIATRSGVITRIIAENGTPALREGSYVEDGALLIEGKIYSKVIGEEMVHAKGIVRINSEYIFEKTYPYSTIVKDYKQKNSYSIGFSVDSNEFFINYLNNNQKYDKLKHSNGFSLFGKTFSFDFYQFHEYTERNVTVTKEEILQQANTDSDIFLEEIFKGIDTPNLIEEKEEIIDDGTTVTFKRIFTINERIGKFVERT